MRVLTRTEMRQIERAARKTQIAKMLSFFDELPRFIRIPKPLLLGSISDEEILIEGVTTTSKVQDTLTKLDEPFNPHLEKQNIRVYNKREKSAGVLPSIHQQLRNGFPELCLLKGNAHCGQKIVRAHSVQKMLFKNHAKNGHVYQFDVYTGTRDANKRLWPDLIGINEATTFTGFCDYHDSQIFSPIDNSPFLNTPEHKFLYHYRAFAQTYYSRAHSFRMIESTYKELAQKLPLNELKSLEDKIRANQQAVRELEPQKLLFEQYLRDKNWSAIEGYAFMGESMPDVLISEFIGPLKNFHGKIIQDCKSLAPLHWVSMTVIASNDRAVFLMCAEKGCPILHDLANSFRTLPPTARTRAILTYAFCLFENFIMLPKWWDSLTAGVKLHYVNAFAGRYYPRDLPDTCDWKLKELNSMQ